MVKGVSKELKQEVRLVLSELVNGEPYDIVTFDTSTPLLRRAAITYLEDKSALEKRVSAGYRITAHGREYWDQLQAPRRYWFRQNWFPASVAGATIVAALVSAAANIVNMVI